MVVSRPFPAAGHQIGVGRRVSTQGSNWLARLQVSTVEEAFIHWLITEIQGKCLNSFFLLLLVVTNKFLANRVKTKNQFPWSSSMVWMNKLQPSVLKEIFFTKLKNCTVLLTEKGKISVTNKTLIK